VKEKLTGSIIMETITIRPQNKEQSKALKAMLKAFKIPFENKETEYNPKFVEKVKKAEERKDDYIVLNSEKEINDFFGESE